MNVLFAHAVSVCFTREANFFTRGTLQNKGTIFSIRGLRHTSRTSYNFSCALNAFHWKGPNDALKNKTKTITSTFRPHQFKREATAFLTATSCRYDVRADTRSVRHPRDAEFVRSARTPHARERRAARHGQRLVLLFCSLPRRGWTAETRVN